MRLALRDVPVDELLLLVAQQRPELGPERRAPPLAERQVELDETVDRGLARASARHAYHIFVFS